MSAFFKKFPLLLLAAAAAIGAMTMYTSSQTHEEQSSLDTLVVGLQSGYPPFEYMDNSGNIIGFDPDVAKLIAEKLGKKLVIKDMEFEGEIIELKAGKIDLIMSGMNITPSRQREISMVAYHGDGDKSMSLIFWHQIPEGVNSMEDIAKLPNAKISVEIGATPEEYMCRKYPQIQLSTFQDALSPLMDVKFGKSLANLVEFDVGEYLKIQHPQIKVLSVPITEEDQISGFGIGIKKENQELHQQIQQIVQELKVSGELKKLEDKWFKGVE